MTEYYLATFNSTHFALSFEKEIQREGVNMIIIPVPREISAGCGLAAKFNSADFLRVKEISTQKHLEIKAFYRVSVENNTKKYDQSS